jgi:uncharacterized protein YjbJ (UPF0337 family)
MKITRTAGTVLFAIVLGLGVSACEKEKGPAEKAGAKIDAAAGDLKDAAEKAKEDIKNAAEDVKKDAEH